MTYTVSPRNLWQDFNIIVVGCGGTGGFVAEGLCRLLTGSDTHILLIDHDRVEPHNLLRQNFFAADVDKFKSQALAERLSRQYDRPIGFSVYPFQHDMKTESFGPGLFSPAIRGIIIGCVDGTGGRQSIVDRLLPGNWWLDAGNGFNSGQVLFGNATTIDGLEGSFDADAGEVERLPVPSMQLPSLLAPPTVKETPALDCAESVTAEDQSPVINQAMATLVLEFVYRFLKGNLTWMGAYIDLETGSLQTVPADPVLIARMFGVKVDTLTNKGCSIGNRYSTRRR